jgi:transcriptional regulator with XRE-family HTH domain
MSKITIPYEEQTPNQRWAIICREERLKRHWVRRELAEKFNVVTSTVTFWEQAKSFPKNESIYMMAELMQVPPSDLIDYLNNTKTQDDQDKPSLIERTLKEADTLTDEETTDLITALVLLLAKKKEKPAQLSFNGM